jgi:hypothetical protein
MLPPLFSHEQYLHFVRKQARRHGALRTSHRHFQVWRKLRRTNLDKAYPFLATIYSPDQGRPARPPTSMLRSYVAMMECGITSVDVWVSMMHDDSFYVIISGFDPADTPGVGTFYDFQDHLLKRLRQGRTFHRPPSHRRTQRDKAEHHKDKNDLRPHRDIVNRLVNRLLARSANAPALTDVLKGTADFSALPDYQHILQAIFYACFVSRSVDLKLIDPQHLFVAGDGTKLSTSANPHGKKLCACNPPSLDRRTKGNQGKKPQDRCRCPRAYRDPRALWGWDSYRKCWVYGYSLYELTAYSFQHACQLPLVVSIADCNRHDAVHGLATLYHACDTFGLPIHTASLDAAHDALGLFRLATQRWHMALVIPLNQRNKGHLRYAGPLRLDNGVPICAANMPMKRCGFCNDRLRIKWRCPLAATKKTPHITTCPHFDNGCSDSPYGRVIYTYPEENYRLHTLIPRKGALWKCHEDARSCAERSVKRKKRDFLLLQTRTAGRDRWFFRIMLAAMCQHIDAWLIHAADN